MREKEQLFEAAAILSQIANAFPSDDMADYDAADFKDRAKTIIDVASQARRWIATNDP